MKEAEYLICPWEHGIYYFAAFIAGLLPFVQIPYCIFQVPYFSESLTKQKLNERRKATTWKDYFRLTAYLLAFPVVNSLSEPMLRHLHKRGIMTCYWVVNSDSDIQRLLQHSAVRGIMTDKPT